MATATKAAKDNNGRYDVRKHWNHYLDLCGVKPAWIAKASRCQRAAETAGLEVGLDSETALQLGVSVFIELLDDASNIDW